MSTESATAALHSPSLNLSFDLTQSVFYQQNEQNFILQQFAAQTPMLQNLGLLDIYLSRGHSIEPHWHPNAAEFVYVVQGEAIVSVLNPFTVQLMTYRVKPPQTIYIPMGWWHWEIAATDHTHLLAIFDNAAAQTVFGSDVLMKTPPEVFQMVYGVNAAQIAQALKPIDRTVIIGPQSARGVEWQIGSR
ncbi:cupin domain-containing protein [Cohnella lupini]|uniref:Cupin type-1 domain-containing protein n=1 Tax=Cohnella lupini TaxID=1294267 RepID=A0A3D9IBT7_9BACL|nr:cupin domain-containing protein [Cohnella lupini]RED59232.1 hypothetical protein DFP95_10770 [Cohnella lupini]